MPIEYHDKVTPNDSNALQKVAVISILTIKMLLNGCNRVCYLLITDEDWATNRTRYSRDQNQRTAIYLQTLTEQKHNSTEYRFQKKLVTESLNFADFHQFRVASDALQLQSIQFNSIHKKYLVHSFLFYQTLFSTNLITIIIVCVCVLCSYFTLVAKIYYICI